MVKESDVQIYGSASTTATQNPEEREGPALLRSHGSHRWPDVYHRFPNELADVATKIGIELRNQYVLGYRPTNPARDGKWRKIKVKLNPPKGLPPLHVYAKTGYYAPYGLTTASCSSPHFATWKLGDGSVCPCSGHPGNDSTSAAGVYPNNPPALQLRPAPASGKSRPAAHPLGLPPTSPGDTVQVPGSPGQAPGLANWRRLHF